MTLGPEKDYIASSNITLFSAQLERPPQAMTGGGTFLGFFLLFELAIGAPSYCFIYGNERQA
jgi:hypothetical protein